jgi:Mlc titration factor MtfA (ptsG expression regulator)
MADLPSGDLRHGFALGRAVDYGTVFLSWETVLIEARNPASGHNLVIHEFAHQLDFLDGYTNGAPALRSRDQTQRWQPAMHGTFQRLLQSSRTALVCADCIADQSV